MTPRTRFTHLLAAVVGIVALAPATWWLALVFMSDEAGDVPEPDHLVEPIRLSAELEALVGLISIGVVVVSFAFLLGSARQADPASTWWRVWTPLAVLAAYVGFAYRVVTAPVVGANIGGSMLLFLAPLVTLALVGMATYQARALGRREGPGRN